MSDTRRAVLCRACRFWTAGSGDCARWRRGYGERDLAPSDVVVEDDEGWAMITGPEFGCVLGEHK